MLVRSGGDVLVIEQSLPLWQQIETRTLEEVKEVVNYASRTRTSLTRIMLDNMVVPMTSSSGDVDISMLKDAVELINERFETEVCLKYHFFAKE